jgi:hypothetical protein
MRTANIGGRSKPGGPDASGPERASPDVNDGAAVAKPNQTAPERTPEPTPSPTPATVPPQAAPEPASGAEPTPRAVNDKALWLWGRLRDFERDAPLDRSPRDLFETMTPPMRADVVRLAPIVSAWLRRVEEGSDGDADLPIDLERSTNAEVGAESAAVGLEALLAPWIELKHRYAQRRAAIEAAVRKETGVSDEDRAKYVAQSLARPFSGGGESSPDAQRYFALRRQIEKRFPPEIGDDEWERVTAPLEVVIDHITSVRPETFVELGIQARAIHYRFWDSDLNPSEEDCSKVRQFLADAMRLAGLPGPMVASSNRDADTIAFAKLFTDELAAKIEKHAHAWFEANKKWDGHRWIAYGSSGCDEKENRRKWAEEVLREAKSGLPRLIGPKTDREEGHGK